MTEVLIMMYLVGWLCNLAGMAAGELQTYYHIRHHVKERLVCSLAWPILVPIQIVWQCINLYKDGGKQ